jgi:hypothetical protein
VWIISYTQAGYFSVADFYFFEKRDQLSRRRLRHGDALAALGLYF